MKSQASKQSTADSHGATAQTEAVAKIDVGERLHVNEFLTLFDLPCFELLDDLLEDILNIVPSLCRCTDLPNP